jgi:hypothetical protein
MSLRLGIRSDRELYLLKEMAKGNYEFEELNDLEKWIVYNSQIDLQPVVPAEQIREYEKELAIGDAAPQQLSSRDKASVLVKSLTNNLKSKLTG